MIISKVAVGTDGWERNHFSLQVLGIGLGQVIKIRKAEKGKATLFRGYREQSYKISCKWLLAEPWVFSLAL